MSERIDHAAKALHFLDAGHKANGSKTTELNIAEAQVHATLAVVAELRTANLIAARANSEFPRLDLRDHNSWATVQEETDERIRERLGLA